MRCYRAQFGLKMRSNKTSWVRVVLLCLLVGFAYLSFLFFVEVRIYFFDSHHSQICEEIEISKSKIDSLGKLLYSRYERYIGPTSAYNGTSVIVFGVDDNIIRSGDWCRFQHEVNRIRNNSITELSYLNLDDRKKEYLRIRGITDEKNYVEKVVDGYLYKNEVLLQEYSNEFERNSNYWKQSEQTWREWDSFNSQIKRIKKPIMILALVALLGVLTVFFFRR